LQSDERRFGAVEVDGNDSGVEQDGTGRQPRRQLFRNGRYASRRQGVFSESEALEDEIEQTGCRFQVWIKEDSAEEGAEEASDDGIGKP